MTPDEYTAFVAEVRGRHDDETAARIIEYRCHPPYRRPRRDVLFPPPSARDRVAGSAGAATGPGGAA